MALKTCKDCGTEVSTKAAACPKCGAPLKPKRRLLRFFGVVFGAWALISILFYGVAYLILGSNKTSPVPASSRAPDPPMKRQFGPKYKPPVASKDAALSFVSLKYSWSKTPYASMMLADFIVSNKGSDDIKDIQITCTHFANSGTQIDSNTGYTRS